MQLFAPWLEGFSFIIPHPTPHNWFGRDMSSLNSPDEYAKKMRVIKFLKGELRCGSYDIQDIVMMSAVHDDYSIVKMVFRMNLVSRKYKILKLIYRKKQN
eukprot:378036_1